MTYVITIYFFLISATAFINLLKFKTLTVWLVSAFTGAAFLYTGIWCVLNLWGTQL